METTKMIYFTLDNTKGSIDEHGWIKWATINCHINSLHPKSGLFRAAIKALENSNPFDVSPDR